MSSILYGRLQGRGKEKTALGPIADGIVAQLETRNAAIRVRLDVHGKATVFLGRKVHDKALPDRWVVHETVDVDGAALA